MKIIVTVSGISTSIRTHFLLIQVTRISAVTHRIALVIGMEERYNLVFCIVSKQSSTP
jgi:hypothetical protein